MSLSTSTEIEDFIKEAKKREALNELDEHIAELIKARDITLEKVDEIIAKLKERTHRRA